MHDQENKISALSDSSENLQNDSRLNLLFEIGRILASLETLNKAAPQILEITCRHLNFELGELWCLGKGETVLKFESVWHLPSPALEKFVAASQKVQFSIGEGLPGRVWASGEPIWIEDINSENKIPRQVFSQETGFQSAFAFPILLDEKLLGVFNFFSTQARPLDNELLKIFAVVGSNIGQFVKREHIESHLRKSDHRYRAFIEQSTEGIWRFELDEKISINLPVEEQVNLAFEHGYLAECNDATARMYGLERAEDLVGSRIADLLDMSDPANVAYIRSFIESEYKLTEAESHERDTNGNDKYFLNSLIGTIENGYLVRVWGTQRDITEQKSAEQLLRASERNFRALVRASSQAIWTTDAKTQNLEAFGWWENQTGQNRVESAGAGFLNAVHPEDRKRISEVWQNSLETVKFFSTECRIVNIEGGYQHFTLRGVPVFDSDDNFRQWIGTLTDITDRKIAEQSLIDNEERYRALVEATSTVVWRATAEGELSFVGASWQDVSGQQINEILGAGWLDALHPEDREKTIVVWKQALATKEIYETEFRVLTTTGEYRWFAVRGVPILDGNGNVREWIGANTDISERKSAEEKIRDSEANFRQLAEAVPQIVWVTEPDGTISYVNQQWSEFSGLTLDDINNYQLSRKVYHPDDVGILESAWQKAFGSGEMLEIEIRMCSRLGNYRWFLTRSRPIKDANGKILKWFGTSTDITDGKQAETRLSLLAEISESTRKFEDADELLFAVSRAIGEHLQVKRCLFNEIDLERDIEIVHRDYCRGVESVAGVHLISEYSSITSADMAAGKTVVNCDSKTDPRTAQDYAKAYEPNGERAYVTIPLLREDRWVASLWISDDAPRQWSSQEVSMLETVAERTWTAIEKIRINAALRESEQHLQLAVEISRISTFEIDLMTDAVETDATGREIYGFAVDEPLTFTKVQARFHPQDRDDVARRVAAAFAPEGSDEFETEQRIIRTDGEIRWIRVRGRAFFEGEEAERKAVYCLGTYIDITQNKLYEEERERLLVSEQQAREAAEEANQAKDEFIALVSHELRSPLNAMLGWTRILQNQNPDEKTKEYALDVIIRNARSQSRLIEDLLDVARVGKGKLRLEIQPTEFIPIINAAIEIIKPNIEANNIIFVQSLDRSADFIEGDVDRLRQVIENLLSNAVKFTPPGGKIEIRLERESNNAKITVSDTGLGISSDFLPQIFERFKQADPSTTRRYGGLGIGLSLARDLVELHGGTILAQSAGEGQGSTFTVTLPLRVVLPIKENSDRVETMNNQGKLSGFWILAVDDEADARELISFMLQINGAKVTSANSAVEALEILKNLDGRLPDVLLSDISMPNESGYALLEKIRALPVENGGNIPAVALTAFSRPEDRQSAFEAGFQKHLGKPVEPEDLISAIIETAGAKQV